MGVSLAAICSLCLCDYVHVSVSSIPMGSLRGHEEDGALVVSELEGVLVAVTGEQVCRNEDDVVGVDHLVGL